MSGQTGLRGPAVCALTGVTYRQLDYWARTGVVVPSVRGAAGSGTHRLYSHDDVQRVRQLKTLLDAGIGFPAAVRALGTGRRPSGLGWPDQPWAVPLSDRVTVSVHGC